MIATAATASKNPIRVFRGSGSLLRTTPIELLLEFVGSMAVLEWQCAKFYARTSSLPVGNGRHTDGTNRTQNPGARARLASRAFVRFCIRVARYYCPSFHG